MHNFYFCIKNIFKQTCKSHIQQLFFRINSFTVHKFKRTLIAKFIHKAFCKFFISAIFKTLQKAFIMSYTYNLCRSSIPFCNSTDKSMKRKLSILSSKSYNLTPNFARCIISFCFYWLILFFFTSSSHMQSTATLSNSIFALLAYLKSFSLVRYASIIRYMSSYL